MLTNYLGKQALYRYSKACSLDPTNVDTSQDRVILAKEMGQMNIIPLVLPTTFGPEDMMFLQFPEAQTHTDFDVDLAAGAAEMMEALGELREAWETLFSSHPRPFALADHDLTLSNTPVNPATFKTTGI